MREQKWLLVIIYALFALLLSSCTSINRQPTPVDVLFVAYDQGESNAFIEIEKRLNENKISYKILAMGRAAEIYANHPGKIELPASPAIQPLRDHRETPLPPSVIGEITQRISPKITYVGMASTAQAQLLAAFSKQGSYTIAFYDNFDAPSRQLYLQPFLKTVKLLNELHVPNTKIRDGFKLLPQFAKTNIIVTGQPALEAWDEIYQKTDSHRLRQQFGLTDNDTVVLFAGGYDSGYEDSFRVFIKATTQLPSLQFLVTHHPKYDGQIEKQVIKELGGNNVQLVPRGIASTAALSKIAAAITTHKSTVGAQAIYKGKPVIYIAPPDYSNFLIEDGLATRASDSREVIITLGKIIETNNLSSQSIEAPDTPSHIISGRLTNKIKDL